MFKKIFCLIFFCLLCFFGAHKANAEAIAPAIQYLKKDYSSAFISGIDYSIKLKTHTRYKLKCTSNITAVAIGDKENIKIFDTTEDEENEKLLWEILGPKDLTLKTRYETYTYIQIHREEGEPYAAMVSVNKKNVVPPVTNVGTCTLVERKN